MANLCTLEDVKSYLDIRSNDDDNLISNLITTCSSLIENYCSKKFDVNEYTETFSGRNRVMYAFRQHPVVSVTSITVDGRAVNYKAFSENELVLADGYCFNSGMLNCQVVYQAGYAEVPDDLKMACFELVGYHYKLANNINVSTSTVKDNTHSYFAPKDIPEYIKITLKPYRRVI